MGVWLFVGLNPMIGDLTITQVEDEKAGIRTIMDMARDLRRQTGGKVTTTLLRDTQTVVMYRVEAKGFTPLTLMTVRVSTARSFQLSMTNPESVTVRE